MPTKTKLIKLLLITSQVALLGLFGLVATRNVPVVHAAGTITVTSNADVAADDGECTFREALTAANDDTASGSTPGECAAGSGTDTIEFNITGPADFTNGGEDGYTIALTTGLPQITGQVIIDGYSQPHALANTAVSPAPLNGRLLIEIDAMSFGGLGFDAGSDNSTVRGLVINNSGYTAITLFSGNVNVFGNYLGTDPTGMIGLANCVGVTGSNGGGSGIHTSAGAHIGGTAPEERNIISGNTGDCGYASGGYPDRDWVIQGNYVGVGADGITAIPNAVLGGSGAFSIDDADGVLVGGTTPGATNVISGNTNHGLAPHGSDDIVIQGNLIGTDYTGTVAVPNGMGINLGLGNNGLIGGDTAAARNVISGNLSDGIHAPEVTNTRIYGNYIGVDITGLVPMGNTNTGIGINDTSSGVAVGGSAPGQGNVIGDNGNGISIGNAANITVQGNLIGEAPDGSDIGNTNYGINIGEDASNVLIGGTDPGAGNTIAFSGSYGIKSAHFPAFEANFSVLGNSVHDNTDRGIALTFGTPATMNDDLDADTGPNDLLNFPDHVTYEEAGSDTVMRYTLDVPAGDHRVEFFSNTAADGSGYGEGETYLDSQIITSDGTGSQDFSYILSGTGHANIAATATQLDESDDGFGVTSEFSAIATEYFEADLALTKTLLNPEDVTLGGQPEYEFTITNNGPDDFDLSQATNSNPGVDSLLVDILPPELTYNSYNGTDVSCYSGGPGSAVSFGPLLANHSDHELIFCGYTGSGGVLANGQSFSFTILTDVQPGLASEFTNYAYIPALLGNDPDAPTIEAAYASGNDIIDELGDSVNNLASAEAGPYSVDTAVTKTLTNPQEVAAGGPAHYQITLTNNGTNDANLSAYGSPGSGPGFLYDFVPADLVNPPNPGYPTTGLPSGAYLLNVGNDDVSCLYGPAPLAQTFGLTTDSSLGAVGCWLTGADKILEPGASISANLSFEVASDSDLAFTNYVVSPAVQSDPDSAAIAAAFTSGDVLTYLIAHPNNNFAAAPYPVQAGPEPDSGNGSSNNGGILAGTGQSTLIMIGVASLLLLSAGAALSRRAR